MSVKIKRRVNPIIYVDNSKNIYSNSTHFVFDGRLYVSHGRQVRIHDVETGKVTTGKRYDDGIQSTKLRSGVVIAMYGTKGNLERVFECRDGVKLTEVFTAI